jgi:hypothetical protein
MCDCDMMILWGWQERKRPTVHLVEALVEGSALGESFKAAIYNDGDAVVQIS